MPQIVHVVFIMTCIHECIHTALCGADSIPRSSLSRLRLTIMFSLPSSRSRDMCGTASSEQQEIAADLFQTFSRTGIQAVYSAVLLALQV